MERTAHWRPGAGLLVLASLVLSSQAFAEERLEFQPQREAAIRMKNGSLVKGRLKSISAGAVMLVDRDGSEQEITTPSVLSVTTNDGKFKYLPAQEPFSKLTQRAAAVQGITISRDVVQTTVSHAVAADGQSPNVPPRVFAKLNGLWKPDSAPGPGATGGFIGINGFGGPSLRPQAARHPDLSALAMATGLPGSAPATNIGTLATKGSAIPAASGAAVFICSNPKCRKEVRGAKYGDTCPYCGLVWLPASNSEVIAANPVSASSSNETSTAAGNPFGDANANVAASTSTAAPTPASPTQVVSPSLITQFNDVPWWGKIGGFLALIFVLKFVAQRR